jgi:ribosomal protein S18 acetylase RimI-like enzyme
MSNTTAIEVREAVLPRDGEAVRRLWLDYLTWGNDEMQARHGVHPHSPEEAVESDMASIAKFQPPNGRLVLAFRGEQVCGVGCLRRIGGHTAEIKRMYVDPTLRRVGAGRAILGYLLAAAEEAGYTRVRLDSPTFMTAAHALYRSHGFVDIEPYAESEIPEEFRPYLVFMERSLVRSSVEESQ